jgi:hypothetical protein
MYPLGKLQLASEGETSLSGARLAAPCVPSATGAPPVPCVGRSLAPKPITASRVWAQAPQVLQVASE